MPEKTHKVEDLIARKPEGIFARLVIKIANGRKEITSDEYGEAMHRATKIVDKILGPRMLVLERLNKS
jgi:hypothetical protein